MLHASSQTEVRHRSRQIAQDSKLKKKKKLTSDLITLSLLIPVTCTDSPEALMCQVQTRRLRVTHMKILKTHSLCPNCLSTVT